MTPHPEGCPARGPAPARRPQAESCVWRAWPIRCRRGRLSLDETAKADRRLALGEAAGRHDQHAIVIGCADFAPVVAADQGSLWRQHLEPAKILNELEFVAGDRDGFGDLNDALPRVRVEIRTGEHRRVVAR